jgi:uroporphyrinogen-III synthase
MAQPPRAIVTRPAREAAQWVQRLGACGVHAQALPLIGIAAVGHPQLQQALRAAQASWDGWRAVMFVSGNAVYHFFTASDAAPLVQGMARPHAPRLWAPGPGTAAMLQGMGVPAACIDQPHGDAAQFDSEALWQVVHGQITPGDRVLVVRGANTPASAGGSGREWLAERVAAAGGQVHFVAAYERRAPVLDAAQQALARAAAHDGSLWLFSSSEAIAHLRAALPQQPWAQARALATHPRIADAARAAGFGHVQPCRPALQDVAASIKSWHEH